MAYSFETSTVLIVDDMKPMLTLCKEVLSTFGFKDIYQAFDGQSGFDLFCRHDPDLVITDWIMEPMTGLEMTRKIRTHPMSPNKFVPVIMMTGYSARARVELSRDCGITEFLVKPFKAEDLYRRVSQIIEKPRNFVEVDGFFGPDRRRRDDTGYEGPRKRGSDPIEVEMRDPEAADILKKLQEEAKDL